MSDIPPLKPFVKLSAPSVEVIVPACDLSPEAQALPRAAPPEQYVAALMVAGLTPDVVRFLSQALPKREGVWWACLAARAAGEAATPRPIDVEALAAAETWVFKPTEDHRRAAMDRAQAAEFSSPQAWAAVGAFWSGGSMAPPGQPVVPPAPHLAGRAIAGAVMLAAAQGEATLAPKRYARFIAQAMDIASGGNGKLG
jgi:hypothetical protein